jgi:uncharacterized protein DUF4384
MLRLVWTVTLAAVIGASIAAQDRAGLTARELFYGMGAAKKPIAAGNTKTIRKPATKPASQPTTENEAHHTITPVVVDHAALGLRYSVLKRSAGGEFIETDADTTFQSGDGIRVTIESNEDAYLYIVNKGSSGAWNVLFPSLEINDGKNRLPAHQRIEIPPADQFVFVEQPGEERLFFVLSRPPEPDLDRLIASLPLTDHSQDTTMSITDDVVGKLRDAVRVRDLVFEKVQQTMAGKEQATYVVNVNGGESSRVVADLKLQHK